VTYVLDRLLVERAVLERDTARRDAYGAETTPDWQPLATVRCKVWWWPQTQRGPAREFVDTSRTVEVGDGGIMLPAGTDVTPEDRVAHVTDAAGNTIHTGPFAITAVIEQDGHIELSVRRP